MLGVVLYTILELLNYYVVYNKVFGVVFRKKKVPYIILILLSCFVQIGVLYFVDNTWRDIIALGAGLIIAPILAETSKLKTIALFPVVSVISGLVNTIGSYGLAAILGISQESVCDSVRLTLMAECTAIIVFTVYRFVVKKKLLNELSLGFRQYCCLILGIICCGFMIAFSQGLFMDHDFVYRIKNEILIASIVLAFLFIVLSFWQQITWKRAQKYQMENEKYQLYLGKQEEHIHMLINEDERRRRLKHDMHAHMTALDMLAQKGDLVALRQYIQKMEHSLVGEQMNKYTGIFAVDAIISEEHNKAIEQHVSWSFKGNLQGVSDISIFELCTIFSNLLENAMEAIEKVDGDKKIETNVSNFRGKIVLVVGNSCDENIIGDARPQTIKKDKSNHGLGLKNVEEIVNKREGSINYQVKNGWFEVTVIL